MVRASEGVTEVEAEHLGALCTLAYFDKGPDVDRVPVELNDVVGAVHVHFEVFLRELSVLVVDNVVEEWLL